MASSDNMTSVETWAFRPAFENAWISEAAFNRETAALTQAFQQSITSGPSSTTTDFSFSDFNSNNLVVKHETTPSSQQRQGQSVSSSGGSETETVSKRKSAVPLSGKITKRKARASKRSPTTFITADPANFRQMVQQVTGVRFVPGQGPVLKPEPQRPVGMVNRLQAGCLLPTLDTSAFLLDHHQQVVGPAAVGGGAQGNVGFGPAAVVAEAGGPGLDFDGFSCFPTLESNSWKVM